MDEPTVTVDNLPGFIKQWAADHDMFLLPALSASDSQHVVQLGEQDMGIEAFCHLASTLGARVLYQDIDRFDVDEHVDCYTVAGQHTDSEQREDKPSDDAVQQALTVIRTKARPYDGKTARVEVSFVHGAVAHTWEAAAPWYTALAAECDDVDELQHDARQEQHEDHHQAREAERQADEEQQAAMAAQLAERPDFRSAKNTGARREIAEHVFPEPQDSEGHRHRFRLSRALATAHAAAQAAGRAVYEDYERRLDELAEELLASGKLDQATGAGPRRILAADFLTERSGGYPPPGRTLTLLLAQPQLKPGKTPPSSTLSLPLT
ncbi:hypothetical protein [Streptomyces sp. NEAU-S77]|uniref:hypothetical protein n=1 Tax=Streptomyces sp. NEAU-S77 TaxID=3411033 RepID=UPI003BA1A1B3